MTSKKRCGHNNHMKSQKPKKVGARELKTRLGTYLRQVREGLTILVTERGEPVAELRPLRKASNTDEGRLEELVALGAISHEASRRPGSFDPIPISGRPLSEAVIEDREERF